MIWQRHYRQLTYFLTFLTGMTGLIYQVAWQRYLMILIGSEARSIAIGVAIFLSGLALGYYYWGTVSEKIRDRGQLLKAYGQIEFAIGVYAILFPLYYRLLESLSFALPSRLYIDLLLAILVLIIPTFLMGATIPMLTKIVPEHMNEVGSCHAKIYGINSLGAVLGAFIGGMVTLPKLGLPPTMVRVGVINALIGIIFIANRLQSQHLENQERTTTTITLPTKIIFSYVAITGAMAISLEIIFIRVMNLTAGSAFYIYPIVVGVFIAGLAIGSLTSRSHSITAFYLLRQFLITLVSGLLIYWTVPYWPYWLSNLRVILSSEEHYFYLYLTLLMLAFALFVLPMIIPLGRLLPLGYSLLSKSVDNYGRQCGRLYFINACGTLSGAVGLSYLLLYWLDLDQIFKINIALLTLLMIILAWLQHQKKFVGMALVILVICGCLPRWDRSSHFIGLFRSRSRESYNFKGIFKTVRILPNIEFFKDDPNTTVAVPTDSISKSIVVNAKSDGNTVADHSTVALLGTLPYLHHPRPHGLKVTVIGMGTGFSAGLLATTNDVEKVTVLEISPAVIKANEHFDKYNFNMRNNNKISIQQIDAFKYLSKLKDNMDLVVSEPSNPWVNGIENLFTPELYRLVQGRLNDDGLFMQWIHTYDLDIEILVRVIHNLQLVFSNVELFIINSADIGLLASNHALSAPFAQRRLLEPALVKAHELLQFDRFELLNVIRLYDQTELHWLVQQNLKKGHSLLYPTINHDAAITMYRRIDVPILNLFDPLLERIARLKLGRVAAVEKLFKDYPQGIPACTTLNPGYVVICERLNTLKEARDTIEKGKQAKSIPEAVETLQAYKVLRGEGLYPEDPALLGTIQKLLLMQTKPDDNLKTALLLLLQQYGYDGNWKDCFATIEALRQKGLIGNAEYLKTWTEMRDTQKKQFQMLHDWQQSQT